MGGSLPLFVTVRGGKQMGSLSPFFQNIAFHRHLHEVNSKLHANRQYGEDEALCFFLSDVTRRNNFVGE